MRLDLRRDFADIYAHVADRVRNYDPATNDGPGDPGPVKMVKVGFEYSQAGWVVVVFDTRPDAEPDGEWNAHIQGNALDRPDWLAAGEANMDGPITLVQVDGTRSCCRRVPSWRSRSGSWSRRCCSRPARTGSSRGCRRPPAASWASSITMGLMAGQRMRPAGRKTSPDQTLHLTGAASELSRPRALPARPRQILTEGPHVLRRSRTVAINEGDGVIARGQDTLVEQSGHGRGPVETPPGVRSAQRRVEVVQQWHRRPFLSHGTP